ncbi:MAG: hypothetical protein MUF05_03015 [Candidatus Omnitrophica bacterium]|jgi:hypothetical protein|nr:hypothetical protein [Candidatus Omnitrophota bacterium]
MKPKIGIVATAHRPKNWMTLYKSIGDNDIDFELVFVGPNPPDYELPNNFRFIHSLVKPAQCAEIAFRNINTELVMVLADDCTFNMPRPLDRLYETYKSYHNEKLLLSCRSSTNGKDESHFAHRFDVNDPNSIVLPLAPLMSKKFFNDLGGIDRNFIAIIWDNDLAMRAYEKGGTIILSDVFLNEDKSKSAGSILCQEFWRHDRKLLENLWTKDGKVRLIRNRPVETFSDFKILKNSQGPRGRWRGNGPIFIEKIADRLNINRHLLKCGFWISVVFRAISRPASYPKYAKKIFSMFFR